MTGVEVQLTTQLEQAASLAPLWQDERRQLVEQRLGVTDLDDPRIVDDPEYRQVMDAVALVDDALAAIRKLAER